MQAECEIAALEPLAQSKAVRLLRAAELGTAYEGAWDEWFASPEPEPWESTAADGLTP